MNEVRLKEICQEALSISYKGVTIFDFSVFPTQTFDYNTNTWVTGNHTLYLDLKKPPTDYSDINYVGIEKFLEGFLGFECVVQFI